MCEASKPACDPPARLDHDSSGSTRPGDRCYACGHGPGPGVDRGLGGDRGPGGDRGSACGGGGDDLGLGSLGFVCCVEAGSGDGLRLGGGLQNKK